MKPLTKSSVIYDVLHERTYHTSNDIDNYPNLFLSVDDPIFHDTEYWMYSDLNSLYGDMLFDMKNMYHNTYYTIRDAIPREQRQDIIFDDLFKSHVETIKTTYDPSPVAPYIQHAKQRGHDLKLTRLAAWALSQQNSSMIFARAFFLSPGATYNEVLALTKQFARISQRKTSAYLNNIVSGIVKQYGGDYNVCYGKIHRAFFYGLDTTYIKNAHGIPDNPKYSLTDYLNADGLAARNIGIQKAINEFNAAPVKNIDLFYELLYKHMTDARMAMFRKTDHGPEHNIERERFDRTATKLKRMESKFIKANIDVKVK